MLLTLLVFLLHPELRQSLAGKIKVGFLSNLALCYIALTDTKAGEAFFRLHSHWSRTVETFL